MYSVSVGEHMDPEINSYYNTDMSQCVAVCFTVVTSSNAFTAVTITYRCNRL